MTPCFTGDAIYLPSRVFFLVLYVDYPRGLTIPGLLVVGNKPLQTSFYKWLAALKRCSPKMIVISNMYDILVQKTKEDLLKNVGNQTTAVPTDLHLFLSTQWKSMGTAIVQVSNDKRVGWQSFCFLVDFPPTHQSSFFAFTPTFSPAPRICWQNTLGFLVSMLSICWNG